MSRSGYNDGLDDSWSYIRWRGAVTSAFRGKRGQLFLREMLSALESLPEKKLIAEELVENKEGNVCALGAVAVKRGLDVSTVDPEDRESVAGIFEVPFSMACEIMYMNDEGTCLDETPEQRYVRMKKWIEAQLIEWED